MSRSLRALARATNSREGHPHPSLCDYRSQVLTIAFANPTP